LPVFLPIAGLSINMLLLIGTGAAVGFLSGLLGVGGGFLLTPVLTMIGIPATVAAASGTNAMVATSSSGVAAHFRLGNVDIKMGTFLLLGGLMGAAIGVEGIKVLRNMGEADLVIRISYVVMLGIVGGLMAADSLRKRRRAAMVVQTYEHPRKRDGFLARLPFRVRFPRSGVEHSLLLVFGLSFVVGILTAIMGVGGGFMLVPLMVYVLNMPAHVAVGTSLFQILFTCSGASDMQATANHTVDLPLALIVALGSAVGAQLGAAVSRKLRGEQLMVLLAGLALLVAGRMTLELVLPPSNRLDASHVVTAAGLRTTKVPGPEVTPPGGEPTVSLSPSVIKIGALYGGTRLHIHGDISAGSDVIMLITGGESSQVFKHLGRAGPIWGTIGKVTVSGVPAVFVRYSSAPVDKILRPEEIERYRLSTEALRRALVISPQTGDAAILRNDYISLKLHERLYREFDSRIAIARSGGPIDSFSLDFHWPRMAQPARYRVDLYECSRGKVIAHTKSHLPVVEVGEPALLAGMATEEAPLYGIFGVIIAALAGFGIDFVTASARKLLSGRAPAELSQSEH